MAQIIKDGLLVCDDCVQAIANDEYSGMNDAEEARVRAGLDTLGGYGVIGDEYGFSHRACDCCGALAGNRHECAVLGE